MYISKTSKDKREEADEWMNKHAYSSPIPNFKSMFYSAVKTPNSNSAVDYASGFLEGQKMGIQEGYAGGVNDTMKNYFLAGEEQLFVGKDKNNQNVIIPFSNNKEILDNPRSSEIIVESLVDIDDTIKNMKRNRDYMIGERLKEDLELYDIVTKQAEDEILAFGNGQTIEEIKNSSLEKLKKNPIDTTELGKRLTTRENIDKTLDKYKIDFDKTIKDYNDEKAKIDETYSKNITKINNSRMKRTIKNERRQQNEADKNMNLEKLEKKSEENIKALTTSVVDYYTNELGLNKEDYDDVGVEYIYQENKSELKKLNKEAKKIMNLNKDYVEGETQLKYIENWENRKKNRDRESNLMKESATLEIDKLIEDTLNSKKKTLTTNKTELSNNFTNIKNSGTAFFLTDRYNIYNLKNIRSIFEKTSDDIMDRIEDRMNARIEDNSPLLKDFRTKSIKTNNVAELIQLPQMVVSSESLEDKLNKKYGSSVPQDMPLIIKELRTDKRKSEKSKKSGKNNISI